MPYEKPKERRVIFEAGKFYHVYNRAVGAELLFRSDMDYHYFLMKFDRYLEKYTDIYAYCLMPNHFHLLLRVKEINLEPELLSKLINRAFSNFFNSYSRSFNEVHRRRGKLFMLAYKSICVDSDDYLLSLISYIHRNPIHHGFVRDLSHWKHSSYRILTDSRSSKIKAEEVISLFGAKEDFIRFHKDNKDVRKAGRYLFE